MSNFRLYDLCLRFVALYASSCEDVRRHDADLARQMRRSLTSVPLNVAEGSESLGRNRIARFRNALGSTAEVIACCDVAEALGYLELDAEQRDLAEHVRATLLNLVRTKR